MMAEIAEHLSLNRTSHWAGLTAIVFAYLASIATRFWLNTDLFTT